MAVDVPPNKFELLMMKSEKEEKRQARHENGTFPDNDWIVNVGLPRVFKYFFFISILLLLVMVLTGNEDGF